MAVADFGFRHVDDRVVGFIAAAEHKTVLLVVGVRVVGFEAHGFLLCLNVVEDGARGEVLQVRRCLLAHLVHLDGDDVIGAVLKVLLGVAVADTLLTSFKDLVVAFVATTELEAVLLEVGVRVRGLEADRLLVGSEVVDGLVLFDGFGGLAQLEDLDGDLGARAVLDVLLGVPVADGLVVLGQNGVEGLIARAKSEAVLLEVGVSVSGLKAGGLQLGLQVVQGVVLG